MCINQHQLKDDLDFGWSCQHVRLSFLIGLCMALPDKIGDANRPDARGAIALGASILLEAVKNTLIVTRSPRIRRLDASPSTCTFPSPISSSDKRPSAATWKYELLGTAHIGSTRQSGTCCRTWAIPRSNVGVAQTEHCKTACGFSRAPKAHGSCKIRCFCIKSGLTEIGDVSVLAEQPLCSSAVSLEFCPVAVTCTL